MSYLSFTERNHINDPGKIVSENSIEFPMFPSSEVTMKDNRRLIDVIMSFSYVILLLGLYMYIDVY